MTTTQIRTGVYECMFLISQAAAADFGAIIEHINEILERGNAEVIAFSKWDERRLAYEIDKQKRGVYFLVYFSCPVDMVGHIERDAQLSEQIMRIMITKADHLTEEEMKSHDKRDELLVETKLRAARSEEESEKQAASKVRLGAPVQPTTEAPKTEESKTEASKDEASKDEAPKSDEPKDEAAKSETPKDEAPKSDEPKPESTKD